MSRFTSVPAGAALEMHAQSEPTDVDGKLAILHVAVWEGNYSQGYKSNYTCVPTRWLVVEVRDAKTGRLVYYPPRYKGDREPRRRCQSFSGRRYDTVPDTFAMIVKRDRLSTGDPTAARRYYNACHR